MSAKPSSNEVHTSTPSTSERGAAAQRPASAFGRMLTDSALPADADTASVPVDLPAETAQSPVPAPSSASAAAATAAADDVRLAAAASAGGGPAGRPDIPGRIRPRHVP